jgi:integrase
MALLTECPKCKTRNSLQKVKCKCGLNIKKAANKIYWIEYYYKGRRRRERIGPSKTAADQRLREVLKNRTEDRFIDRNKNVRITYDKLSEWYLNLPQIKAKRSYARDVLSTKTLGNFFSGKTVSQITLNMVEAYRLKRLNMLSYRKQKIRPATVNREIACLRHIFNLAEKEGKIESVPFKGLKALKENNVRNRILTPEEYDRLLEHCPPHTARVVKMAYYTAMRQGEILNLTWGCVDLGKSVVRLSPGMTKTDERRVVPLHPEVVKMLKAMPKTIHGLVFTRDGRPLTEIKKSFRTACTKAKIEDFRFHDLRHTCINNWRLQGHDFFRIMAASGHKTMEVFKRYNTVTEEELMQLVEGPMDTYMDTKGKNGDSRNWLTS